MTRKSPIYLLTALFATIAAASCNEKSDDPVTVTEKYANTAVTSFSLQNDDSVAEHLDSVFFSIDLIGARIFNADSLPVGTDVSRLLVKVGTSSAKSCDLTFRDPSTDRDTTINIIENPNDSINFANGPVKMVVTSYDGSAQRTYEVKVNVHKTAPDTLKWDNFDGRAIPSTLTSPKVQKTVMYLNEAYTFTADGDAASLARTATPFDDATWTVSTATLPQGADVNSIEATSDALYLIDRDGNLHTSSDGLVWSSVGVKMNHIYGGYGSTLLGARHDSDGWKQVTYPATTEKTLPASCPVGGTSQLISYTSKWSSSPMAITLGGRKADGSVCGDAWVYDGDNWTQLSTKGTDGYSDVTLFPYMTIRTNDNYWRVSERSALLAIGGRTASGAISKTVYISFDFGITWEIAESYLQLPLHMTAFAGAQALVFDTTLPVSRVTKPIEEWECPYIYIFGGYNTSGSLINEIRRGVINRFSFKPIY